MQYSPPSCIYRLKEIYLLNNLIRYDDYIEPEEYTIREMKSDEWHTLRCKEVKEKLNMAPILLTFPIYQLAPQCIAD
jgi:hypothetical protein